MLVSMGQWHAAQAQDGLLKVNTPSTEADTNYFKLYEDYLTISPYIGIATLNLTIQPRGETNAESTTYTSNNFYHIGLGLCYNDIALFMGMGTGIRHFPDRYGQTKYQDYGISLVSGGWMHRGGFLNYSGMAETSALDLVPDWDQSSPFPFRGDMSFQELKASSTYFFNHRKFDANTLVNLAGHHRKSANSFSLTTGIDLQRLKTDSSWVPTRKAGQYAGSTSGLDRMDNLSLTLVPGWAGVWAGRRWFLAGFMGLGARGNYAATRKADRWGHEWGMNPELHLRVTWGYNSPTWFFFVDSDLKSAGTEADEFFLIRNHQQVYYTIGYRFHSPQVGKVLRKVPVLKWFV